MSAPHLLATTARTRPLSRRSALIAALGLTGSALAGAAAPPFQQIAQAAVVEDPTSTGLASASPRPAGARTTWGWYGGPGAKGLTSVRALAETNRVQVGHVLDFLPDTSWQSMVGCDWLINAHRGSGLPLELSVPLIPRDASSLAKGAAGAYDDAWRAIARKVRSAGLAGTTVMRPGWEANGAWYPWTAVGGKQKAYVGAFRRLVATMRSVAPDLRFSWSMNAGYNPVQAETIYPGDDVVDYVGVDVYDYDWSWYPRRDPYTHEYVRAQAWKNMLSSPRGLTWFSGFARAHAKPLAISEWGLAWRADGHAGGDNVAFVVRMADFCRTNDVAWATYFNNADTAGVAHNITAPGHRFPSASTKTLMLMRGEL